MNKCIYDTTCYAITCYIRDYKRTENPILQNEILSDLLEISTRNCTIDGLKKCMFATTDDSINLKYIFKYMYGNIEIQTDYKVDSRKMEKRRRKMIIQLGIRI